MKKLLVSALVLSLAFSVRAQDIPERKTDRPHMMEGKRHHRGMEAFKGLNLTEDQKAKFKTSNETFRQQMAELKKNDNITVKEWREKMEGLRKAHQDEVKNILTPAQKEQMKDRRKEMQSRQQDMQKKMADRMKTNLNLTAEQSAKMEANHKAMATEMKNIRENKALTEQQKREKMMELHKKQKETLKSILTEEQLQKLKEKRQDHKGHGPRTEKDKTI